MLALHRHSSSQVGGYALVLGVMERLFASLQGEVFIFLRRVIIANHILEENQKVSPSHQEQEHIPQLVKSYVYAGLASSQAGYGEKKDALPSLKKAQTA